MQASFANFRSILLSLKPKPPNEIRIFVFFIQNRTVTLQKPFILRFQDGKINPVFIVIFYVTRKTLQWNKKTDFQKNIPKVFQYFFYIHDPILTWARVIFKYSRVFLHNSMNQVSRWNSSRHEALYLVFATKRQKGTDCESATQLYFVHIGYSSASLIDSKFL